MAAKKKSTASAPTTPRVPQALFDAVYLEPSSDAPRESLARALSEAGDPRGELISLQLTKARGDKLTKEQDKREKALLKAHGEEWLGPFAPRVRKSECVFERGFPSLLWFKTVSTQEQIQELEATLLAEEWATVKKADSLLKLSAKMRSLRDAGSSIEALRDAAQAKLQGVVPLETLRVINLWRRKATPGDASDSGDASRASCDHATVAAASESARAIVTS